MLGKLLLLMIMSIFVAAVVLLFTEPRSEFHAKVKLFMSVKLFELRKMFDPDATLD